MLIALCFLVVSPAGLTFQHQKILIALMGLPEANQAIADRPVHTPPSIVPPHFIWKLVKSQRQESSFTRSLKQHLHMKRQLQVLT